MLLRLLAIALALLAASGWAQQDTPAQQLARVNAALGSMSAEQAAVYQQFQMVQEMRRSEERRNLPLPGSTYGSTPANFDDVQRAEDARAQRIVDLASESDRLYARYRELEERKRVLLDTLSSLAQLTIPVAVPPALLAPDGSIVTRSTVLAPDGTVVSPVPLPTPGALTVPGVTSP